MVQIPFARHRYMRPKDMIFYKANKVGNEKIDNCDHQITSDVDKFSEIFAMVLSQVRAGYEGWASRGEMCRNA